MCVIVCAVLVVVLCINAFVYQRSHYLRLEHDKMREVRKVAKLIKESRTVLEKNEKTKMEPQKNTAQFESKHTIWFDSIRNG